MLLKMDPRLVHRILLAGPNDFESLRSPEGDNNKRPLSFQVFSEELFQETCSNQKTEYVIKRAFYDTIVTNVQKTQHLSPILKMLLDLHKEIRSLVPNRNDLHSVLNDERLHENQLLPNNEESIERVLSWIQEAATALVQLESPEQSKTTREWIEESHQQHPNSVSYLISSIQYLIDKTSICQDEKTDFYLINIVAPKFYNSGKGLTMERQNFQQRFGGLRDNLNNLPISRSWIEDLVLQHADNNKDKLRTSIKARQDLITRGWIKTILFNNSQYESSQQQQERVIKLPEIFFLDVDLLQQIRSTTRIAAAGCALGLHACSAARCNSDVMMKDASKGKPLVQVLSNNSNGNHHQASSIEEYEQSVQDTLVGLAQSWSTTTNEDSSSNSIEEKDLVLLRGRTHSVLQGNDPVFKLLNDRMQNLFCDLAVSSSFKIGNDSGQNEDSNNVPIEGMKTGRGTSGEGNIYAIVTSSPFVLKAKQKFIDHGLSFYADDLAKASELAMKISKLAYELYGEQFIDPMIIQSLDE